MSDAVGLALLLLIAAVLYTSVGHAGASGYLAAMALYGLAPERMRPVAFVLNLIAATPTTIQFLSAGHFDRRLFIPLAIGSVPFAFLGSSLTLPDSFVKPIIGIALVIAAVRLLWTPAKSSVELRSMPIWLGVLLGIGIGLISGLTGVGGGIYLTPVLLIAHWATTKTAAGVSSAFILVNSLAGLIGRLTKATTWPDELPVWAVVVVVGSLIGSTLGSRVFGGPTIRRVLALVLLVAAAKLIFG